MTPTRSTLFPWLAAAALLAACGAPEAEESRTDTAAGGGASATTAAAPPPGGHDWAYEGEHGPEHWGDLPAAATCATGQAQSPIDLTGATARNLPDPQIDYRPGPLAVTDLGHTAQILQHPGNVLTLDGRSHQLAQIHHHTPSEHTVDGEHADAELHLVHKDPTGRLAVLGVLVTEGAANPQLQQALDAMPEQHGATASPGTTFDPAALLPADRTTYRYSGSLTTPPCTEGVAWSVFTTPITASAAQIEALESLSGENNRPVQERGDRTLRRDTRTD